jgi:3D (Asp-Asp-Asp) domain-containing protein/peptidoglycan hydrolase CwlO-like protein
VRGRSHRLVGCVLVPLTGFLLVLGTPATGPAQSPGVGALREKQATLAAESRQALVELYGLDSRLAQTQADLARLDERAGELARRQASARNRLGTAVRTQAAAQRMLGRQLRILYQEDQPDPIAIVLGATSLDEAIEGLETAHRTASATERIVAESRRARTRLQQARRALAAEVAEIRAARTQVAATAAELEQAHSERSSYLEQIRRDQELTAAEISSLEERAQAARQKAATISAGSTAAAPAQPPAAPASAPAPDGANSAPSEPPPAPVEAVSGGESAPPAAAPAPPRPGRTMTVFATGYCLHGTTATGLPVGPGIVAVDPAVIPLGTRMTIPDYGEAVAADVGSGISGARIDVWIASCPEAATFTRTVTITFH